MVALGNPFPGLKAERFGRISLRYACMRPGLSCTELKRHINDTSVDAGHPST